MQKFKAGAKINQGYCKSFQPHPINKQWELQDMELLDLLSQADRHMGRLDMYCLRPAPYKNVRDRAPKEQKGLPALRQ
jgi:hypothetical protein